MNNDELLEKIGKMIETKLEAERGYTKRLFESEREHTKQLVEASEGRLMKKIDQRSEQLIDVITDTATVILDEYDGRITQIENHLGLSRPPKN
jgi:macrodomain Ter protein organizer (MatP/YcbG family)